MTGILYFPGIGNELGGMWQVGQRGGRSAIYCAPAKLRSTQRIKTTPIFGSGSQGASACKGREGITHQGSRPGRLGSIQVRDREMNFAGATIQVAKSNDKKQGDTDGQLGPDIS